MQEGLPAFAPADRYRYVLLDIWFLTVTRRSVALGAKAAALTFTALQARAAFSTESKHQVLRLKPGRQGRRPHVHGPAGEAGSMHAILHRLHIACLSRWIAQYAAEYADISAWRSPCMTSEESSSSAQQKPVSHSPPILDQPEH